MRRLPLAAAAAFLVLGAAALLVPLRHGVVLERVEGNAVQRLLLESRSLAGLRLGAWGARVEGEPAWGSAREGFFLAPTGPVRVQVNAWPGFRRELALVPSGSGTGPALADQGDREAFRAWFVAILEEQLQGPSPLWEPAQRDCAGLLRVACREAGGPQTDGWRARVGFTGPPVAGDPRLQAAGPWRGAFPTPEGWRPFAKGALLRSEACVYLGRELSQAQPGDLVFFARGGAHAQPDHAMAFVRADGDGQPVRRYHAGAEGSGATRQEGELGRVRVEELLHHPDPAFRPLPENTAFLGLYRWKVLAAAPLTPREPA